MWDAHLGFCLARGQVQLPLLATCFYSMMVEVYTYPMHLLVNLKKWGFSS